MATITNYLNGNYLLNITGESSLILIQYQPQRESQFKYLNQYQIQNQLETKKPFLLIQFDQEFDLEPLRILNKLQIISQTDYLTSYINGKYSISGTLQLNKIIEIINTLIEKEFFKEKQLQILLLGVDVLEYLVGYNLISKFIDQILSIKCNGVQLTLSYCKNLISKELYEILNHVASCTILQQDCDSKQIIVEMILKKPTGYSFIKKYILDYEQLKKSKLKVSKVLKSKVEKPEDQLAKELKTSFSILLSEDNKKAKVQLDTQINPYKQVIKQTVAPLIYNKDEDLKRMIIDVEQEDEEEDDDYYE